MRIIPCLLLLVHLWMAPSLPAQSFFQPLTGAYHLLPAFSDSVTDLAASFRQPAALAGNRYTAIVCRGERRYGLPALAHYQGMLALPAGPGSLGLQWNRAGDALYREQGLALLYGRRLGAVAEAGIRIGYQSVFLQGYGASGTVSADAGLLVQAGQDWRAGISFLQFGGGSPDSGKASFWPVTIQVGSGYRFSPQLYVIGFIEKTRAQPLVLQGALLYQLVSSFQLRGGYSWPLAAGWMGAGWTSGKLDCHLIFHLHPQLGLTPALTVQYRFSKKGL